MFRHVLPGGCALRLLEEADLDELHELIDANRDHLAPWMPWAEQPSRAATAEFLKAGRRQLADNDGLQAAIVDPDDRIIGSVGFHGITWKDRATSIGYWLARDRQGRGTMTEAVRAMIDHAFGTWRLNRIELHAAPDNEPSRYVAQRLGFREEGLLRQAERFSDGYRDLVLYAIVAEDWYSSTS